MSEAQLDQSTAPSAVVSKGLAWLSRQFALAGGLIMMALAIMQVVSIIGRSAAGMAVQGDYELVEMGLAMAVFLFLPECYLRQGHVVVDLFTAHCRQSTIRFLEGVGDLLFLVVSAVLVWRLTLAGIESRDYWEQSMILGLPHWWMYAIGVVCCAVMAMCAMDQLYLRARRLFK
ncbi:MAG: hypothetical protein CME81_06865 [Halomonas sp.]|nr:hypothetical protein [Halomonas sp.]|tara:strand:+ start:4743 stop:5264 length:522 start_codon:yes stop_codon:yes gene_type:complete